MTQDRRNRKALEAEIVALKAQITRMQQPAGDYWDKYLARPFGEKVIVAVDFALRYGGRPTHDRQMRRIDWTPEVLERWCADRVLPDDGHVATTSGIIGWQS